MLNSYIDAIKGFVPKLIALVATYVVARLIYELIGPMMGINDNPDIVNGVIESIAVAVAASLLTVLVVTALDEGS